ncbi:bifunctional pyr operon transcriptional regulator/uracil phosphoribosyltransferase PyrR [Orrella daihaiensis]|uniref:Bifunctional pyr operon transcriptional regulator/uracil phosphoribosyltransferase PyrR n=1 Tax=Orrella daihaiensis TaxID=2782176 RepID=A0ABY4AJR5_9BURK|nr:bifunctional pyr operon transcriptional regulator/uracil phosphoribosyltransferase PyrR [Orrella daihaiensis]UOD50193.1 bifunctional pyr operon transcriptional regulator/uracil phosphoribosyltransferase PyrR [Orrella daihaiensis]
MTPPAESTQALPAAEDLYLSLRLGVAALIKDLPADEVHLVGIHSGGAWLAQRLHRDLQMQTALGTLNISFYRDDFDRIGLHPQVEPSDIGFDVVGKHLVVVDDVLYTGRTIRGAMNELFDYGRPASIKLVVLIDRDQRELPICADFAAWRFEAAVADNLVLAQTETGEFTLHVESKEA